DITGYSRGNFKFGLHDSNATLGEGKFGQVTLASYKGLPVAEKQFNAAVLQAEIEHEANIVSSFKHLNLLVFFGVSCSEKPYLLNVPEAKKVPGKDRNASLHHI
ncbi:unnamed protein product, partial [Pocillopora meandrina]